jgi:cytochrome P450 family 142 subfamily A polypeptide 1
MINLDEPEHQAQRNLVSRRFTPGAVRSHEEHVRDLVTGILDDVVPLGECEAVEAIASRLPAMMIGELLGYPPELWEKVRWWSEDVMRLAGQTSPDGPPHVSDPGLAPVIEDMVAVTMELIEQRRVDPRDDLISTWTHTEGWDAGRVFEEVILVLDGGAETTRTVIGTIIRQLALQPEQRDLLLARPELLASTAWRSSSAGCRRS